jgi:hypothetical protein
VIAMLRIRGVDGREHVTVAGDLRFGARYRRRAEPYDLAHALRARDDAFDAVRGLRALDDRAFLEGGEHLRCLRLEEALLPLELVDRGELPEERRGQRLFDPAVLEGVGHGERCYLTV